MEIVRDIGKVPIDANERPRIPVEIFDCGEVDDLRVHLRQGDVKDLFRTEMIKEGENTSALPNDFGSSNKDKVVTAIARPALIEYESSSSSEDEIE